MSGNAVLFGTKNDGTFMSERVLTDSEGRLLVSTTGATSGGVATPLAPDSADASGITPVVDAGVSKLVVKASPGNFYDGSVTTGAVAGYLIAYNAIAAPADAAVLDATKILGIVPVDANSVANIGENRLIPDRFSIGVVLLFSTSVTNYAVPGTLAVQMRGRAT